MASSVISPALQRQTYKLLDPRGCACRITADYGANLVAAGDAQAVIHPVTGKLKHFHMCPGKTSPIAAPLGREVGNAGKTYPYRSTGGKNAGAKTLSWDMVLPPHARRKPTLRAAN